ncbi:helix-turn-helix domain-containing protein [Sphingobacterium thalpophilum]|uniref:helix-turn-helix domain-containing protein n=1 Tax=Sphingobacterium thalpophilum TaxID=259 RepID=UPI003DA21959
MANIEQAQVFFYCTEQNNSPIESFMAEHKIWHIQKGYILFFEDGKTHRADAGQTILLRRNQLVKASLMDNENGEKFEMIKILLSRDFLNQVLLGDPTAAAIDPISSTQYKERFLIAKNELFTGFFESLKPYIKTGQNIPGKLSLNKTKEIFLLLEMLWPGIKKSLFDFSEPIKLDLAEFMTRNYSYNVTLERFAYLSGRSLATFKRDFKKIYNLSPHKWLMKKRLEEAKRLIFEEKQAPCSIYLQVGFENLSHFSTAFKKFYGFNASSEKTLY